MRQSPFSAYVSYDLRAAFRQQPEDVTLCFTCRGKLSETGIAPSRAAADELSRACIPVHDYSRLFSCVACGWWCVREVWFDAELPFYDCDYLIVGVDDGLTREGRADDREPWVTALNDPTVYKNAAPPPPELVQLFVADHRSAAGRPDASAAGRRSIAVDSRDGRQSSDSGSREPRP